MQYQTYDCHIPADVSNGFSGPGEAHTSFFPIAPFAVGLGLGLLPWAVAGAAYGGCRGTYCGPYRGPYGYGGPYGYRGPYYGGGLW